MNNDEYSVTQSRLQEAADSDTYKLRDDKGVIFWVDTVTDNGAYINQDEGGTHFLSFKQLQDSFICVET